MEARHAEQSVQLEQILQTQESSKQLQEQLRQAQEQITADKEWGTRAPCLILAFEVTSG
jgi:hypothetical protein